MKEKSAEERIADLEYEVTQLKRRVGSAIFGATSTTLFIIAITLFFVADGNAVIFDLAIRFTLLGGMFVIPSWLKS